MLLRLRASIELYPSSRRHRRRSRRAAVVLVMSLVLISRESRQLEILV
jgi:hypothetical protein